MAKISTFTAKMQRPGQPARTIPNAVIHRGYMGVLRQVGRGKSWEAGGMNAYGEGETWTEWERYEEIVQPLFNGAMIAEADKDKFRTLDTIQSVIDAGLEKFLLKFGEQDGYTITDLDAERAKKDADHQQAVAEKQVPIPVTFGYFGLRIGERLPADTWAKIKHLAEYHRGEDSDLEWLDDMGHIGVKASEVRGWYYEQDIVSVLTDLGYTVQYAGHTVSDSVELQAIRGEQQRQEAEHFARVKEIRNQAAQWHTVIRHIAQEAGPCTHEVAEAAGKLPIIKILDMQGPDIYGGGAWLHTDGDDLFYVRNNGMDGDNWSYNNYPTGGAGAICYRIPGSAHLVAEIRAWVDSLGQYAIYAQD